MKFKLIIDPEAEEQVVVTANAPSPLTDRIESLICEQCAKERIVAYMGEDMVILTPEEIECITVVDGKTYAIDENNRRLRLKQRLYELEAILPPQFIRINKSTIANEQRIVRFAAAYSGAVDAVFRCGYKEYVSRRCFAAIKRRYEAL